MIVKAIKTHQALLLMSWRRRKDTAQVGRNVASPKIISNGPSLSQADVCNPPKKAESINDNAMDASKVNSVQYQYSLRIERPLKSTYLLKPDCMASVKFIF